MDREDEQKLTLRFGKRPGLERDEERPPTRPWLLMVIGLLLAGVALWAGFEWKQGADRETKLRVEVKQVYLEAEQLRSQAAVTEQRLALAEKQLAALLAEREATTKRLEELEAELSQARVRLGGRRPIAPTRPSRPGR